MKSGPFECAILVFRHGETDWNKEYKIQGHSDIPLNDAGRTQALELAERLCKFKIDVIVSSDLLRAYETAQIALRHTGLDIHITPELRESHMGDYEGVTREALQERAAGELWRRWISNHIDDFEFALPGGEKKRDAQERMRKCLETWVRQHPGKTIAVSTHGGSLRRLIQLTDFVPPDKWLVRNCALYRLKVRATEKAEGWDFQWHWQEEVV